MSRWTFGLLVTLTVAGATASACSRVARTPRPVAALPSTPEAAAAHAVIRAQWEANKPDVASLEDYLTRFPKDGAATEVKLYLALVLLDRHQQSRVDSLLASLGDVPRGATKDLATIARARSLRLSGAPQSALDALRPLVGKIIDDADREVFLEELALSAIAAKNNYEALAYLDAWLNGVSEDDRDRVRVKVAQIIDTLPRPVLEQTYRTMRTRGVASGYGPESQKLVAARLARIAVDTNDAALARWLLDVSGTSALEAGGDAGVELGELATSRRGLSLFAGRTVGLLLPARDRGLRDEAADVVRGLAYALDLPQRVNQEGGVRLVTRDDGVDEASTRASLEELAGEGAGVILAGFDRAGANRASAWAEKVGLPVVLLAVPSPQRLPRVAAFVLAERTERELVLLAEALAQRSVTTAAFIADDAEDEVAARSMEGRAGLVLLPAVRCDVPLSDASKPRFPVDAWLTSTVQGYLVSGPRACARDVLRELSRAMDRHHTRKVAVGLTLEAGVPLDEVPSGPTLLSASAGIVPVLASAPSAASDPTVREFMSKFGVRPSYWTALGRDAGVLAKSALASLPSDTTADPKLVAERRAQAVAALLAARAPLWSTDDRGFGTDRILPRTLRVVTWRSP